MLPLSKSIQSAEARAREASKQLYFELASGASGLALALFMWGHMVLVGSILTGERGFDWLAGMLEDYYIAQPTVLIIFLLFLVHAVLASRKIPAQLAERRQMIKLGRDLKESSGFDPHRESLLWIWQVRTGMLILVLGSFHLILLGIDVMTPLFGAGSGIEAVTSIARVRAGLWLPYAILLVCVEFHAGIGLYRLAIKWSVGAFLTRKTYRVLEHMLLWFFLGLGVIVLLVLAEVLPPPLTFLLSEPVI
jgi:fumarate reductase subunit C